MAEKSASRPLVWSLFLPGYVADCDDPQAAPARHGGPGAARPFTWRRAVQNMVWVYASGLIFMAYAIAALPEGDPTPAVLAVRIVLTLGVALGYLGTAWIADCSLRVRWLYIAGYVGLLVVAYPVWGWNLVGFGAYVAIMLATLLPWRQSRVAIVVWALMLAATIPLGSGETATYICIVALGMGLATAAGMEAGHTKERLRRAQRRVDTLSVAAERERIGRDLHDILGHSLTAISIKAGLAGRLVDVDPEAAKAQIAEIEQVSRQALADVRTTASGMREVRLATEIASARSVLMAAGIESRMPSALPSTSDDVSELFGYVVRESVTNVVRHSGAGLCTVIVEPGLVEVRDDGRGMSSGSSSGSGLDGLRARVETAGGTLTVTPLATGGTVVRVELASTDAGTTEPDPSDSDSVASKRAVSSR